MSLIKSTSLIGTLAFISKVAAHGIVTGVVADGTYFQGYSPDFQYQKTPPEVAGWTAPLTQDHGFVDPTGYNSPDIICHKGATPGKAYIPVSAGGKLELQWTVWPESHHGPMLDYLAPCGDDCTTVDKSSLQWTKIDEAGMNSWVTQPGDWASDDMIRDNNTWVTTIPSSIAPGKYVLRHETIALHSANNANGAQNYPQCMNIEVSGSGSNSLISGTLGTDLYKSTDPGILVNIYYPALLSYDIPGPPVMAGGSNGSHVPSASASAPASSSAPADFSVTAKPTTGIAVPSGEPSIPSNPPNPTGDSTVPTSAASLAPKPTTSSSTSDPYGDWSSTAVASGTTTTTIYIGSKPTDSVAADTAAPSPTGGSGPSPDTGSGSGPEPGSDGGNYSMPSIPTPPPISDTPSPSTASPPVVSFSSTITGRIGKPTRFVCYMEED